MPSRDLDDAREVHESVDGAAAALRVEQLLQRAPLAVVMSPGALAAVRATRRSRRRAALLPCDEFDDSQMPAGRIELSDAVQGHRPGGAPGTRAPTAAEPARFVGWLGDEGLPVRRRITKGRSVMAACGQLGDLGLRRRST